MIKAVIFDCFGVLKADGWKLIREEFFAGDDAKMREAMDMDKAVNAGFMDYDNFIGQISAMTGLKRQDVTRRLNSPSPNVPLFAFIRDELKPRYKVGMLSNAADDWLNELFEPWQVGLFDETVLSYQVGMVKPDPAIYQLTTAKLGVLPDECLFVDDVERYCTAAEALGMRAVHHQDTNRTIATIEELLRA